MTDLPDSNERIATALGSPRQKSMSAARNIDKLTMLAATGTRMAVGMLTFIILARYLGPAQFGIIASAIAYTSFASTLSDFGFGVSGLRLASADIDRSAQIIGDAAATKIILFVLVTIIGGVIAVAVLPTAWLPVYALVHIGSTANGLCELLLIAARARRRFKLEARLVISSSTMMLLIFGGVTALTRDLTAAAGAFAFTRILYLMVIRFALREWLEPFAKMGRRWGDVRRVLGRSTGFAADSVLTLMAGQVDVLLFSAMMPVREFGVYQAGARLVQVFVSFAPVLSSVYLPGLSSASIKGDEEGFRSSSQHLTLEFAGLAVLGGLGFMFAGPFVTPLLYGAKYQSLASLWPGFAAFALLRFGASGFGIQLAALGHVRTRIFSSIISIACLSALAIVLLPRYGLSAAPFLLAAGALPSILILGTMLARDPRSSRVTWATLPALVTVAAVIILS